MSCDDCDLVSPSLLSTEIDRVPVKVPSFLFPSLYPSLPPSLSLLSFFLLSFSLLPFLSFSQLSVHSFNTFLLSTSYVQAFSLGSGDTAGDGAPGLHSHQAVFHGGGAANQQVRKRMSFSRRTT